MSDIKTKVRNYIFDNFLMGDTGTELQDDQSFVDSHIIDSTGFIELITFLETEYNIQIKDAEMIPENLDSLNAIDKFVTAKFVSVKPAGA